MPRPGSQQSRPTRLCHLPTSSNFWLWILLALWTQPAFHSYPSWVADWRALQETHVKRCIIFYSGSPWGSSDTIRWLSRALFSFPQNWTSATPVNLVFNSRFGTTGVSWALLVYMQNCQPTLLVLIDRKVKLVDLFKTVELLNNRYAFYMLWDPTPIG